MSKNIVLMPCLLVSLAYAIPSHAQQFEGLRLGATIGYDRQERDPLYYSLPDDLAGVRVGGTIGYDITVAPKVTLGAHAGAGWVLGGKSYADLNRDHITSKPGLDLEILGRVGYLVAARTLLFANAGFARSTVRSRYGSFDPSAPGGFEQEKFRQALSGLRLGSGVEQGLTREISVTLEYRYTDYQAPRGYHVYDRRHQILAGVALRL